MKNYSMINLNNELLKCKLKLNDIQLIYNWYGAEKSNEVMMCILCNSTRLGMLLIGQEEEDQSKGIEELLSLYYKDRLGFLEIKLKTVSAKICDDENLIWKFNQNFIAHVASQYGLKLSLIYEPGKISKELTGYYEKTSFYYLVLK